MILLESCEDVVQNLFKIDFTGRHIVSFVAVIRVVTQRLVGEKRCVTTLITAAKETRRHTDTQEMMFILYRATKCPTEAEKFNMQK